jgi:8-oxo-dGTP pyrophosphatase MutT (NUDIX family)
VEGSGLDICASLFPYHDLVNPLWSALDDLPPVSHPEGMRAAVLVALYEDGDDLRLILIRRSGSMPTHAGEVAFPGGMIEPGDGGPQEAALREAWEEIGLPPDAVEVLGGLEPLTARFPDLLIVPVVGRVLCPVHLEPDHREVDAIIEPSLVSLLDESRWRTERWNDRTMWFYDLPEAVLWGATARMVRSLLAYFRP